MLTCLRRQSQDFGTLQVSACFYNYSLDSGGTWFCLHFCCIPEYLGSNYDDCFDLVSQELVGQEQKCLQCEHQLRVEPVLVSIRLYELLTSGSKARNCNMTLNYHLGDTSGRTHETVFSAPQGSYVTTTEEIRSWWVSIVTTTYRFWAHRSDRDDIVLILIEFPPVFFQIAARGCRYHSV